MHEAETNLAKNAAESANGSRLADLGRAFAPLSPAYSANPYDFYRQAREQEPVFFTSIVTVDPPQHTRLRTCLNKAFSPHSMSRLEPHIRSLADQLINFHGFTQLLPEWDTPSSGL